MQHRDPITQARAEVADELGCERDLRHQDEGAVPAVEDALDELHVNFRLAAAGHAQQQKALIVAERQFDLGDDGVIFVDAATMPSSVTNEDKEADCTVRITMADLESIAHGDLDAMTAFMMGKLKASNLGLATQLQKIIG